MGSNFMQQFMAGWQMGQGRNENRRRDQDMQLAQQQEQRRAQQDAIDNQMRQEHWKLQKQQADLEFKRAQFDAKAQAAAMTSRQMQQLPPETQDLGGGTTLELGEMTAPRAPMMAQMPGAPEGTPEVQLPFKEDLEEQQLAERQQKIREALGLEQAKLDIAEPYKAADDERAAALAAQKDAAASSRSEAAAIRAEQRAATRTAAADAKAQDFGVAKSEGERKAVSAAQFAVEKMPDWQNYIKSNQDIFGPVAGRWTKFKQSGLGNVAGIKPSPEVAKRQAQFAVMRNGMINALSGAAVSPAEYERLKEQIPELTDDPVVVSEKLAVLDDFFRGNLQRFQAKIPGGQPAQITAGAPAASGASKYKILEVR